MNLKIQNEGSTGRNRVSVVLALTGVSLWLPSLPPIVMAVTLGLESDSRCVILAGEKTGANADYILIKN